MTLVAPVINDVPALSRAARTATHHHEVGNTVMHSALRRDFARAARMLAGKPDARHRRALAAHLQWMLQVLHHHHNVEDQAIWPAVTGEHDPEATTMRGVAAARGRCAAAGMSPAARQ